MTNRKLFFFGSILLLFFFGGVAMIPAQTITVTQPAANDTVNKGITYTITWRHSGTMDANVKIRLFDGRNEAWVKNIVDSTANDGSFPWEVPDTIADGRYCLRVRTVDDQVLGVSGVFSIATLTLREPFPGPLHTIPQDYSIDGLGFKNYLGEPIPWANNQFVFPYNGVATSGTALVRVRRASAVTPAGCSVRVETLLKYLSERGAATPLGQLNVTDFNSSGIAEVNIPFTVRAGERDNVPINIQVNLVFGGYANCDSKSTNNSRGSNLTLKVFNPRVDMVLTLNRLDFKCVRHVQWTGAASYRQYHFDHKARVKNLLAVEGGTAHHVICRWQIQMTDDSGAYRTHREGNFIIEEVSAGGWAEKAFSSRDMNGEPFWVEREYSGEIRLVVEVDPHERHADISRSNNRLTFDFRID